MNFTTSLEMSKKLKEAGFNRESLFAYTKSIRRGNGFFLKQHIPQHNLHNLGKTEIVCNAYLTDELLEEMPSMIRKSDKILRLTILKTNSEGMNVLYYDIEKNRGIKSCLNLNHPDALAEMWLWLKKKGFIN